MRKMGLVLLGLGAACATKTGRVTTQTPVEPAPEPVAAEVEPAPAAPASEVERVRGQDMTDANVVAALLVVGWHEVNAAELVAESGSRDEVRAFARALAEDHSAAIRRIHELRAKLGLDPRDDDLVRELREETGERLARLQKRSGRDLDRAFLEMAVEDHRRNEDLLAEDLLAAARHDGLRSLMRRMRATDQRHLDEARRLLGTLSAGR